MPKRSLTRSVLLVASLCVAGTIRPAAQGPPPKNPLEGEPSAIRVADNRCRPHVFRG